MPGGPVNPTGATAPGAGNGPARNVREGNEVGLRRARTSRCFSGPCPTDPAPRATLYTSFDCPRSAARILGSRSILVDCDETPLAGATGSSANPCTPPVAPAHGFAGELVAPGRKAFGKVGQSNYNGAWIKPPAEMAA